MHVRSIADRVEERLAQYKIKPVRKDAQGSAWILHDYGDVVLHVMREDKRQFYDLETLWTNAQSDPNLID